MNEIWKTHPIHKDYQVSSFGRVMSFKRKQPSILKPHRNRKYFTVEMDSKPFLMHRLVAMLFIDNPKNLPEVNHIDANPENNNVINLEWTDHAGNMAHAVKMGLIKIKLGEKAPNCKISESDVLEIRRLATSNSGLTQKQIGKKFGLCQATAYEIIARKIWKHI